MLNDDAIYPGEGHGNKPRILSFVSVSERLRRAGRASRSQHRGLQVVPRREAPRGGTARGAKELGVAQEELQKHRSRGAAAGRNQEGPRRGHCMVAQAGADPKATRRMSWHRPASGRGRLPNAEQAH